MRNIRQDTRKFSATNKCTELGNLRHADDPADGPRWEHHLSAAGPCGKAEQAGQANGGKRAAYELGTVDPFTDIPIYDPGRDRLPIMGGPCLSHVSVKLTSEHTVHLTGFYRSHWYVQRALGNLLGLAHLQTLHRS